MRSVPHGLKCLNTWYVVPSYLVLFGEVMKSLKVPCRRKHITGGGAALRIHSFVPLAVCSLCYLHKFKDVGTQLSAPVPLPSWTLPLEL